MYRKTRYLGSCSQDSDCESNNFVDADSNAPGKMGYCGCNTDGKWSDSFCEQSGVASLGFSKNLCYPKVENTKQCAVAPQNSIISDSFFGKQMTIDVKLMNVVIQQIIINIFCCNSTTTTYSQII